MKIPLLSFTRYRKFCTQQERKQDPEPKTDSSSQEINQTLKRFKLYRYFYGVSLL